MSAHPAIPGDPPTTTNLRPELRLLLCGLQPQPNPEIVRQIQDLLHQPLDWNLLLDTAGWHGALPLLYYNFKRVAPEQIPARVLNQLQAHYHANDMRNIILSRELLRLLELLAAHGIEAVPYKGPALALTLYGNLALRHFTDVDILVRPRDVLRARDVLLAEGYQQKPALNPAQERLHLQLNNVFCFTRPQGQLLLELHWAITRRYLATRLYFDNFWPRLKPVLLNGVWVPYLSPEDLLLVLCVHGSKHSWESLKWVGDVAMLIQTYPALDWDRVITLATATGDRRKLWLGFKLAHELLAAELPDSVLRATRADPAVTRLAEQIMQRLAWPPGQKINAFQRAYDRLRLADRTADRLSYCLDFLFSPDELDLTFVNLPPGLTFLYRPLRLVRLVKVYGLARWQV